MWKINRADVLLMATGLTSYLVKLTIFLLIPGLHLIVSGRKALGLFMLVSTLILSVAHIAFPFQPTHLYFWFSLNSSIYAISVWLITIIFVAIGANKLPQHRLGSPLWLFSAVSILLIYQPQIERFGLHVEFNYHMCPAICFGDVAIFDTADEKLSGPGIFSKGRIIVYESEGVSLANRVFYEPGQLLCLDEQFVPKIIFLEEDSYFERITLEQQEYYVYAENFVGPGDQISHQLDIVRRDQIKGVEPVVVTNISKIIREIYRFMSLNAKDRPS